MGISTHILDTTLGRPASAVPIALAYLSNGQWVSINDAITDTDGRCKHLLPEGESLQPGTYRIHFETASYFSRNGIPALYPYIDIVFLVADGGQHHHIPLLLTANSYMTYRGT